MRYLARFDCTEQRLRTVLARKLQGKLEQAEAQAAARESIDRLIDRFKALGYVNDKRFALRLVESLRSKGASTRMIRERLRARGVDPELLTELFLEVRTTSEDDLAAARTLVKRRKMGAYRALEQQKARYQRDLGALARAGFSFEVARRALALTIEDAE